MQQYQDLNFVTELHVSAYAAVIRFFEIQGICCAFRTTAIGVFLFTVVLNEECAFWGVAQSPPHSDSSLADFSTLKMEAIPSSKTSVHTRSTRRHIPEDGILHSDRRESPRSYFLNEVSVVPPSVPYVLVLSL
jgi:hypothetical protein